MGGGNLAGTMWERGLLHWHNTNISRSYLGGRGESAHLRDSCPLNKRLIKDPFIQRSSWRHSKVYPAPRTPLTFSETVFIPKKIQRWTEGVWRHSSCKPSWPSLVSVAPLYSMKTTLGTKSKAGHLCWGPSKCDRKAHPRLPNAPQEHAAFPVSPATATAAEMVSQRKLT